jgi:photosystem II stability/assembly factor-like uncharacterized protein
MALVASALVLLVAGSGTAGVNAWSSSGPFGGSVTGMAIEAGDPSRIFVSTDGGGIFRSEDSGATWEAANNGQNNLNLTSLAMAPSDSDTLYSVSASSGVHRTTDGGDSWESRHSGITVSGSGIYELAVHSANPAIVYAATQVGVFKTVDGGGDWDLVGSTTSGFAVGHTDVTAIAVHPTAPTTVFAASGISGPTTRMPIYVSTNSGTSWTELNAAEPQGEPLGRANTLVFDTETPTTMYAGASSTGLWKTTDGGVNWTQIAKNDTPGVLTNAINGVAVEAIDAGRVYLATPFGFSVSEDSGATWTMNNPLITGDDLDLGVNTNAQVVAIDPDAPNNVYGGTSSFGVLKSVDAGDTWAEANDGLIATNVAALSVAPSAPRALYASMNFRGSGVVKSTDAGATWSRTKFASAARGLAVHPTDPDTVLLATDSGMFRTTNGGMTTAWTAVNTGLPASPTVFTVAFDPVNPQNAYAGLLSGGIYKSTNGGSNWTAKNTGITLPIPLIRSFAFDPDTPTTVYAATNSGIYKSENGGDNWTPKNVNGAPTGVITGLAVDPATPQTVYAAKSTGVYKSEDGGDNWVLSSTGLTEPTVDGLVVDPDNPQTLYASTSGGPGLFRSTNGAGNWATFNTGLTAGVNALAVDAINGAYLYAATGGGGVFTHIVDALPPTNPDLSSSHTPDDWSNDPSIDILLGGAEDDGSGVDGYAYEWDTDVDSTLEPPVKAIEETETSVASGDLAEGDSHYFHLRTLDYAGRWSDVITAGPFLVDTTPPTDVALTGAALNRTFQRARQFSASWTGQDALSGIDSYTLETRANNGAWQARAPTAGTGPATVSGSLGQTLCMRVTARDEADNTTTSSARCTSIPYNNTQLTHSRGWTKKTGAGYYQNTYSTTTKKGASLKKTLDDVDKIALVVTKCRGCGTLAVYWRNARIATVRLAATTTRKKRIIQVADFSSPEDGVLRLVVTTSGRPLRVEGLGVLRATS